MEKRRIFAWIGIIIIPLMYVISIILSVMDAPIASAFLMATIIITAVVPISVYLLTKYPKHIAEMFTKAKDLDDKKEKKTKK